MTRKIHLTVLCLTLSLLTFAQTIVFNGKVINALKQPLSGASVICKNIISGKVFTTTTSDNGDFQFIGLIKGGYDIEVEYVGYTLYKSSLKLTGDNKLLA